MNISVFYAHGSSATETEVKAEMKKIQIAIANKFARKGTTTTVKCTSGKQAWTEGFNPSMAGEYSTRMNNGWAQWAGGIAKEKDRVTGKSRYDIFVCPDRNCGSATHTILSSALTLGRPVFLWEDGKFRTVSAVLCHDSDDWKSGFRLYIYSPNDDIALDSNTKQP